MASSTLKGTEASIWASRSSDSPATASKDWLKDRELGAQRGSSRGRGRGARGKPIAGRGRIPSTREQPARKGDTRTTDSVVAIPKPESSEARKPTLSQDKSPTGSLEVHGPPKGRNRRQPSKQITDFQVKTDVHPPPAVSSIEMLSPVSPSTKSGSRRRHKRTPSSAKNQPVVAKTDVSDATTGQNQIASSPSKDVPPHLPTVSEHKDHATEVREEVEQLVERVRAIAMDNHRPSSPATHIDWAGDDDDSLPDLDDWGVTSTKSGQATSSEPSASSSTAVELNKEDTEDSKTQNKLDSSPADAANGSVPPQIPPKFEQDIAVQKKERRRGRGRDKDRASKTLNSNGTRPKTLAERIGLPTAPTVLNGNALPSKPPKGNEARKTFPAHPSLPPKPASSVESLKSSSEHSSSSLSSLGPKQTGPWKSREVWKNDASELSNSVPQGEREVNYSVGSKPEDTSEPAIGAKEAVGVASSPSISGPIPQGTSPPKTIVEPPTPLEEQPGGDKVTPRNPFADFTRTRASRPLSGDLTPRQWRDRSPYKTHSARNHSAPHAGLGGSPNSRLRTPHANRPILSLDALQRINKSLNPTPPRKDSPAPSAISAGTD